MKLIFKYDGIEHSVEVLDEALLVLASLLAPKPAQAVQKPVETPTQPIPQVGPVAIVGMETTTTKRDGTPLKSAKYRIRFDNGKAYSTFSDSVAEAARTLWGMQKKVYYTTEHNGNYENLATIRSAEGMP